MAVIVKCTRALVCTYIQGRHDASYSKVELFTSDYKHETCLSFGLRYYVDTEMETSEVNPPLCSLWLSYMRWFFLSWSMTVMGSLEPCVEKLDFETLACYLFFCLTLKNRWSAFKYGNKIVFNSPRMNFDDRMRWGDDPESGWWGFCGACEGTNLP